MDGCVDVGAGVTAALEGVDADAVVVVGRVSSDGDRGIIGIRLHPGLDRMAEVDVHTQYPSLEADNAVRSRGAPALDWWPLRPTADCGHEPVADSHRRGNERAIPRNRCKSRLADY